MGSEVEKIVAVPFWTFNDTFRQYVNCECFFELLVVTVLSVSHLVAFIRVKNIWHQLVPLTLHGHFALPNECCLTNREG